MVGNVAVATRTSSNISPNISNNISTTRTTCRNNNAEDECNSLPIKITNEKTKKQHDVFARFESSSAGGRGQDIGWTRCPLCPKESKKRYAFGRGISSHLHAVHTPWNPSKSEIKYRTRLRKRVEWMKAAESAKICPESKVNHQMEIAKDKIYGEEENVKTVSYCWEPSSEEVVLWGMKVLELTALVETSKYNNNNTEDTSTTIKSIIQSGYDRTGKKTVSYRDSLSPFHTAAGNGTLDDMKHILQSATTTTEKRSILYSRDRNGSTAEHWSAGGGHIHCLEYLLLLQKQYPMHDDTTNTTVATKIKRRDGKTSLHYAARNGHLNCIELLLRDHSDKVDEASGDGTTPLHMACYGGKIKSIQYLIQQYGANPFLINDWGCDASHWIAMTINTNHMEVVEACSYLYKDCELPFHTVQKQGHTSLHKAAQRKNIHVIKWLAEATLREGWEREDDGGNTPSDILESVGGDMEVVHWMRVEFG